MAKLHGGQLVVDALKREGVEHIFSLSGGHINAIYQACIDSGIKVIDVRHEQAAAHMAEAWGRMTRKPGVCVVTAGPGFTDCLTGVANARQANSPVLIIAGRSGVSEAETLSLQELEQIDIIKPLIKWGEVVYETRRLEEFTAMAFRHALTGRPGPVFLEVPVDVLAKEIDEKDAVRVQGYRPKYKPAGAPEGLEEAMKMLRTAQKPLIIAGSGAYYAEAWDELKEFCNLTHIPVLTSLMGRGVLPDDDPHFVGRLMSTGLGLIGQSDLVLLLGARLSLYLFFGRPPIFSPTAQVIQVDIEGSEIGRNRKIDLGIVGDVKEVLKGLIDLARQKPLSHRAWMENITSQARNNEALITLSYSAKKDPIHPALLVKQIDEFLDRDAIVVADGGDTQIWTSMVKNVYYPGHYLDSGQFGCLGIGIPFGLAAKLKYPDKQVLVMMGDGSAGLNLMEFNTALRFNLPIVMVISNDCSWGMIRHSQKAAFGEDRLVGCELGEVAYEKMVQALGGYGERVDKLEDVKPALKRAFASKVPACLNVYTDRSAVTPVSQMLARLGKA